MKVKFLDGREEEFETLKGQNLQDADLRGACLRCADLRGAYLRQANLGGANLEYAYLRGAVLEGANLSGANLHGANLEGADLRGAKLHGADLRGADMTWANLRMVDLTSADLRGADMMGAILLDANLDGAKLTAVDGEKTPSQRTDEIAAHYEHAKEKHPVFADILTHNNHTSAKHYKRLRDEAHANGDCSPLQVLLAEYAEVLEAIAVEDKAQAVYECYDCIAVLLRLIDMIEETAEKEGWLEEMG